jgi:hypothetical protein
MFAAPNMTSDEESQHPLLRRRSGSRPESHQRQARYALRRQAQRSEGWLSDDAPQREAVRLLMLAGMAGGYEGRLLCRF